MESTTEFSGSIGPEPGNVEVPIVHVAAMAGGENNVRQAPWEADGNAAADRVRELPNKEPDAARPDQRDTVSSGPLHQDLPDASLAKPQTQPVRKRLLLAAVLVAAALVGYFFIVPWVRTSLDTVSTDDAYVNGHVTFVAPRVGGHVSQVLVDDNYRVKTGDVLVQLDPEPYQVQVAIRKAAVEAAARDVATAQAQVRGFVAQARAKRYQLEHAIEDVDNQIALLQANVATLDAKRATLGRAQADFKRAETLLPASAIARTDYDQLKEALLVAEAQVKQAYENICQTRVSLGLPAVPPKGHELTEVPPDLDQTFSTVRQALGELQQSAAQLGYYGVSWTATPKETIATFYRQDPAGDLNRIYARLIANAPTIKQAEAKLDQTERDLDQAKLNLRYCTIVSDIDGVVTGRNVNPGNNVQAGQSLMAVRSIKEIWIDANFKETQLADLRIGQPVRCEVDMYGKRRSFDGRITGFTMGTGQTLALLPPQNATGNFVKIVQRLPVRIELTNYDPDKTPLFVGLSVTPYVYFKDRPAGPHAGDVLQPLASLPAGAVDPKP
jgi:membrane fusion protein, multidrug efflux system